jgi:pimeloyl-ACP methyl ester carboxylesterase
MPGFDDSAALDGIDGPEDVVFWLVDLLSGLDLDKPIVLGCGLGGWMAAELAVRYPELLGGLIVVNAYGLQVDGALPADEFALTPAVLRPLVFSDPESELAQDWVPATPPPDRAERMLHARVAAARLCWQFPYSPKLRGRLSRAEVSSLVLWGEMDQLISVAHAHAYAEGLSGAYLATFPESSHYPYIEEPERFAREVLAFLAATNPQV